VSRAAAVAATLMLLGCGDDTGPLCDYPDPSTPPAETRALTIGDEAGPWTDGQEVPLIFGGQGGIMVTPILRVDGAPVDDAPLCVLVTLVNDTTVEEASPGLERLQVLDPTETGWESRPLEDFLGFSPSPFVGEELTVRVTVVDEASTFEATGEVTIVLAAPT
jgi:hypothetical protein